MERGFSEKLFFSPVDSSTLLSTKQVNKTNIALKNQFQVLIENNLRIFLNSSDYNSDNFFSILEKLKWKLRHQEKFFPT